MKFRNLFCIEKWKQFLMVIEIGASSNSDCSHKSDLQKNGSLIIFLITLSRITDRIGRHKVLLTIHQLVTSEKIKRIILTKRLEGC